MSYNVNFPHGLMFHRFYKSKNQNSGIGALNKSDFAKDLFYKNFLS